MPKSKSWAGLVFIYTRTEGCDIDEIKAWLHKSASFMLRKRRAVERTMVSNGGGEGLTALSFDAGRSFYRPVNELSVEACGEATGAPGM